MSTTAVLLSLGSNIHPARQRIREAIRHISAHVLDHAVASNLYSAPPVGFVDQPDFVNAAIVGATNMDAHTLHKSLKELEVLHGRIHRGQWRERELDVDIILFGDSIISNLMLSVPHPRFRDRRFVLEPALEIAAEMTDPVSGKTIAQLHTRCSDASRLTMLLD